MIDIRQVQDYADYMREAGWVVERKDGVNYFIKKLPLIGSFIKVQRPEKLDHSCINVLIHRYRAFQIVIEPTTPYQVSSIKNHGYKLNKSPFLPSKTLHLDLTKTKKELSDNLDKDVRYSLRKAGDVKIYDTESIMAFHKSWKSAVSFKRAVPSRINLETLKKAFENNSVFLVTPSGSAGAIFLFANDTGYYWQAFTSKKGRKELAQYKIVWAGIIWAKEKGAKIFDFEGIYDKRFPKKNWGGFSKFKKKFGGHEVEYPGAFSKIRFPNLL